MKKLFILVALVVFISFPIISFAEEIKSGIYTFDLSTDGSMDKNGTSTFMIGGSASNTTIDMSMVKPNFSGTSSWSLQVWQIRPGPLTASSNNGPTNTGGVSPWYYSGVTYVIKYATANKSGIWTSGTTIAGNAAISLSGNTTEVVNFNPQFAKYYKFTVASGITQFSMKAVLLIH